jgi:hypothetical protein
MLMTPGARKPGIVLDVDHYALMFAVTAKAFEAAVSACRELLACDQPSVGLAHIEIAVRISVADIAVAANASVARRSAPWPMTRRAIVGELLVGLKQHARFVMRAWRQQQQREYGQHARNRYRDYLVPHTPTKYNAAST